MLILFGAAAAAVVGRQRLVRKKSG